MADKDPIFIFGYGRSGTNWLLNLMDLHRDTHCRNEPNELRLAPLGELPHENAAFAPPPEFGARWDEAVHWAATHFGERDRIPQSKKSYLYELPFELGLWRPFEHRKLLKALSVLRPSLRLPEWPLPPWLGRRDALDRARPILKLVTMHRWAAWVLEHRPTSKVVHIVRYPAGVHQSWSKRYLALNDAAEVLRANIERLRAIGQHHPDWRERFGDLSTISVDEAEMWFWRYSTEDLYNAGQGKDNYLVTVHETMVSNPVEELKRIYDFCGLSFGDEIERRIDPNANHPNLQDTPWHKRVPADSKAVHRWRETISDGDRAMVEAILRGTILEHWWN
jgi:hypothetical protein